MDNLSEKVRYDLWREVEQDIMRDVGGESWAEIWQEARDHIWWAVNWLVWNDVWQEMSDG